MNLSNNTILVTGGSSGIGIGIGIGIGFGLAAALAALDNTVIVTGRDPAKLSHAQRQAPRLQVIRSDVTDSQAVVTLFDEVSERFPNLNILINNAGIMRKIDMQDPRRADQRCPNNSRRDTGMLRKAASSRGGPSTPAASPMTKPSSVEVTWANFRMAREEATKNGWNR